MNIQRDFAVDDAVYVGQKIGNLMAFENMKPTLK
jgi:hypothetical protein